MNKRILIVDDDPALYETVRGILAIEDIECVSTREDFLASLATLRPTHIVLEPAAAGFDVIDIVRQLALVQSTATLVFATRLDARLADAVRRAAAGKGVRVAGVIAKPVNASALCALLDGDGQRLVAASMSADAAPAHVSDAMEKTLRAAVRDRRIHLVYQPKIACDTRKLVGFEALARWETADGARIAPLDFIPLAEQLGLIRTLTAQLLEQGLAWLAEFHRDDDIALCVNLSTAALVDGGFPEDLAAACFVFGIEPRRIILELTETATMRDPANVLEMVTRLRLKGFHAAIDDVGTGYSSLAQLVRLPFSELKVDRAFVRRVRASGDCRKIVDAFIQLGHRLGLLVIAEGVEDAETLDYLVQHGCDCAQGNFIAQPMTADAASHWQYPPLH